MFIFIVFALYLLLLYFVYSFTLVWKNGYVECQSKSNQIIDYSQYVLFTKLCFTARSVTMPNTCGVGMHLDTQYDFEVQSTQINADVISLNCASSLILEVVKLPKFLL